MSPKVETKKRANFTRERTKRSLMDGLATTIYDKNGKVIFNGMDHADALINKVDPLKKGG